MDAEKIHLIEYQCPSCGADLHYREDQFMITCKYCGARVERELDRTAQDKVNAAKQLGIVKRYIEDTNTLNALRKKQKNAKDRVKLCSENALVEPNFIERFPFIILLVLIPLAAFMIFASKGDISVIILLTIIMAVSVIVFIVQTLKGKEKKRLASEAKARLDAAQKELVKAGDELEAFEKKFNKDVIPEKYRSMDSLKYLEHVFETAQACSMGEGFKLCDDYQAQKRIEEMKSEQLARVAMMTDTIRREQRYGTDDIRNFSIFGGASKKTTTDLMEAYANAKQKMNNNKRG